MIPTMTTTRYRILIPITGIIIAIGAFHAPGADARTTPAAWASCYGPGLYGNEVASSTPSRPVRLWPSTVGVAHRTLPLGTVVRIGAGIPGRTAEVRVIDRGPFVAGRTWDVTERLAQVLGYRNCDAWGVRRVRVTVLR